jgi:vancomycin resistance protein VanJ
LRFEQLQAASAPGATTGPAESDEVSATATAEQLPAIPPQRTGPGAADVVVEARAGTASATDTVSGLPAAPTDPAYHADPSDRAPIRDAAGPTDPDDPDYDDPWPSPRRQIAIAVRILCVLMVVVLLGHRFIPDVMGVGSLIDTFLPWTFVPLLLMVPAALVSRSRWAIGVAALACGVWAADFGPQLFASGASGPADLRVLSQNVSSQHPDLASIARLALARDADIVVLQGMSSSDLQDADSAAPAKYPYRLAMYEFSVWSKYRIGASRPMDLGTQPEDAGAVAPGSAQLSNSGLFGGLLKFTVSLDSSRTATVFAVHLPQPNLSHHGFGVARGAALDALAGTIKREPDKNLIVVGDLDLAQTDRGMGDLIGDGTGLVSAQAEAGTGFGFTWPAGFPMVRLDDVLSRGLTPVRSTVLGRVGPGSAHRPIEVDLRF